MPQDRAQKPDEGPDSKGGLGRVVPPAASSGPALPPSNSVSSTKGTYFLGRYRVVDEIGIGGMASVHLARMDGPGGFQKWVAIKRIHPHLIEDDSFIHMFLDEARIAARISHPNVATVFELGKHDDTYWIAMEYLHGEPLREVMRKTEETGAPMPPEIACRVIADAAEGLHAAHELLGKNGEKLNLIHRDVTPHNLFVTYEGTTKVVDFGIAKFSSRMSSTRAGTLKGKLAYMSPEQVQGETIDRRTDIFALGVVLWELTTGQRLFRMDSDLDTLAKVQECNIPRPSSIVRGYPIDLEKIVMKALAKNRGERFKTAREFSRMLQSLLMRRGLFIASDEVASYVQSIFKDRIEKREAHLRWAGEVTQTINVDALQGAAHALGGDGSAHSEVSFRSDHSDVQAAGSPARQPPRPAAGVPAMIPHPTPPVSRQSARLAAPPLAASSGHQRRAVPSDYEMDDADDAPTLQATVAQVRAAREPAAAPPPAAAAYAGGSGFGDDFEEMSDTIVETRPEEAPQTARPAQAPLPAAGRPAQSFGGSPTSDRASVARTEPRPDSRGAGGPRTLPLNTMSPVARGSSSLSQPTPSVPLMPRITGPQNVPLISDPSLPQTLALSPGSPYGAPLPVSAQTSPEGVQDAAPAGVFAGGRAPAQTMPRLFAPPTTGQTQTVSVRSNKAPWWAVAILAATAVGIVSGAILLLVSLFSSPRATAASGSASTPSAASATAAPAPTAPPSPATPVGAPGPFVSARSEFLAAIVPQPSSATPPPPAATNAAPEAPAPAAPPTTAAAAESSEPPAAQPETPAPEPAPTVAQVPTPVPQPATPVPQPAAAAQPVAPSQNGRRTVPVSAAASQGFLSVICLPGCDQIYDNGKLLGSSPVFKRPASVGSHKVKLVSSNPPATKTISAIVQADQVFMVRESMP